MVPTPCSVSRVFRSSSAFRAESEAHEVARVERQRGDDIALLPREDRLDRVIASSQQLRRLVFLAFPCWAFDCAEDQVCASMLELETDERIAPISLRLKASWCSGVRSFEPKVTKPVRKPQVRSSFVEPSIWLKECSHARSRAWRRATGRRSQARRTGRSTRRHG